MGAVWRCTYFLRANGFSLPQNPSWVSGCNGSLPVAASALVGAGAAWVVPCAGVVDVVCWAKAGIASAPATSNAMRLFFILNFLRLGERFGLHSSTPESVLRDF